MCIYIPRSSIDIYLYVRKPIDLCRWIGREGKEQKKQEETLKKESLEKKTQTSSFGSQPRGKKKRKKKNPRGPSLFPSPRMKRNSSCTSEPLLICSSTQAESSYQSTSRQTDR